jgi:hypothetical protein
MRRYHKGREKKVEIGERKMLRDRRRGGSRRLKMGKIKVEGGLEVKKEVFAFLYFV